MHQINRLLFHKYVAVARSCKHGYKDILAGFLLKTLNFGGVFDRNILFQGRGLLLRWSLKPHACSRRGIIGDFWEEMGEIVTFSKAFAEVESDDDILLSFEIGYSKTVGNTGRSKGSVKMGTFPLHTGTCPLHTDIFLSLWKLLSQENTSTKTS